MESRSNFVCCYLSKAAVLTGCQRQFCEMKEGRQRRRRAGRRERSRRHIMDGGRGSRKERHEQRQGLVPMTIIFKVRGTDHKTVNI